MNEFERTEILLGPEAMNKLSKVRVLFIGCGGVNMACIDALSKASIGHIDIVDNDIINSSNINRQLMATHNTIGQYKVDVMKKRVLENNPRCEVNVFKLFLLPENLNLLDFKKYDYIVDGIDTITTKLAIIEKCYQLKVNIISCMGTGNKLDPSRLEIADIYQTSVCPLAKVIRHELRKRGVDFLKVCYSKEEPLKVVAESEHGRHSPGSISFVPPVAGYLMASEVVKDLIKD